VTARRAVVAGRVQGVGFRFFAARAAQDLGVNGWVRNRPDGTVETFAEGAQEAVELYLERLRLGPRVARVDSVTVEETAPQGFDSFEVSG
jgi:acylphosphatase